MKTLRRLIHPVAKVLDSAAGLVEYVASDESLDSYNEVISSAGWKFDQFAKNAPFVDSHDYSSIEKCLGRVMDFAVKGKQLVETVQWAIDVPTNIMAIKGFQMTAAGYLKAVSVGFIPTKMVNRWDSNGDDFQDAIKDLGMGEWAESIRTIYLEQQQKELSACVLGANPNALARSYKAGILTDADLDFFSSAIAKRETASRADDPADARLARQRARTALMVEIQTQIAKL